MTYHFSRMALSDKFEHATRLLNGQLRFEDTEAMVKEIDEVSHDLLSNTGVTGKLDGVTSIAAMHGIQGLDPNLFGKLIEARGYVVRDPVDQDREPLHLFDMFRRRGLFTPTDRGTTDLLWSDRKHNIGDVRFLADCVEDLPAHGGGMAKEWYSAAIKKFGNHCQVGICQVWEWGSQAPSMIDQMYDHAIMSHDYFADYILHYGAPQHCIYGFLNHPDIDTAEVAATKNKELCDPSKPATAWVNKDPHEIIYDIMAARKMARIKQCYTGEASNLLIADDLYCILTDSVVQYADGCSIMDILRKKIPDIDTFLVPLVTFNTAGPATEACPEGTPIMMTGDFSPDSMEVAMMPTLRLDQVTEAMCWKTPFISAISSVVLRRPNRFCKWMGM